MTKLADVIEGLGGATEVGRRCGVTASAVSNWVARDAVSAMHALAIWRMATAAGLDWTPPGAEGLRLVEVAATAEAAA